MAEFDNHVTVIDNKKSGKLRTFVVLACLLFILGLGCYRLYSQFPGISYPNANQVGRTTYDADFLNPTLGMVFSQKFEWNSMDTLQEIGANLISEGWRDDVTLYGTTHQYRTKPRFEYFGPLIIQHSNWIKVYHDDELAMSSGETIASIFIWLEFDGSIIP
jgi:hypothetical protein